eukprot:TRINITY_DN15982_c0_g1_i1.p1 TRINITY_DN15982_c0_g1~~TRINITY_DN15982_c0_g1_i1.p1  ORF type:complete len:151 (-),score=26.13 TRINITY_DN15982_c0_g1_i1:80-532(-)
MGAVCQTFHHTIFPLFQKHTPRLHTTHKTNEMTMMAQRDPVQVLFSNYRQIEQVGDILQLSENTKRSAKQLFNVLDTKRGVDPTPMPSHYVVPIILYYAARQTMSLNDISSKTGIGMDHLTEWQQKVLAAAPEFNNNNTTTVSATTQVAE